MMLGFQSTSTPPPPAGSLVELFETLESPLLHYARQLTGSRETAEDLVQEAFLRLQRQGDAVRMPRAWLYRTVHNLAMDHGRRHSRESTQPESDAAEDAAAVEALPNEVVERLEMAGLTRLFVEELGPPHRAVIRLRFEENLSYKEIAARLDLSVSHVGVLLHHAVRGLADEFAKRGIHP